jgi:hypothetical protein
MLVPPQTLVAREHHWSHENDCHDVTSTDADFSGLIERSDVTNLLA